MSERQNVVGAASGALGLGTFAAAVGACCGFPWAVAVFGVTGAVAFARLAYLLPYAIAGAAVLLAMAFWWAYRRPVACSDGTCERTSRRALQWTVWIAAALVVGLTIFALTSGVMAS